MVNFLQNQKKTQTSFSTAGIKLVIASIITLFTLIPFERALGQTYTDFAVTTTSGLCGCANCNGNDFWITNVTINGPTPLNYSGGPVGSNPGGACGKSQLDLTGDPTYNTATVNPGSQYTFTASRASASYKSALQIYIDWNKDGTFGTSGTELVGLSPLYTAAAGAQTFTVTNYTIPAGTAAGAYRMRVVSRYNNAAALPNGNTSAQGEAKDFRITVVSSVACTGAPAVTTVTPAASGICSGASKTLSLTGLTVASGYTYLWKQSSDGTTFVNAANTNNAATYATPTTLPYTNTYYKCEVSCGANMTPSNVTGAYTTNTFINCYCTPAATVEPYPGGGAASNLGIFQVKLIGNNVTLDNSSISNVTLPCYTLYSAAPVPELSLSSNYTVTLKFGPTTNALNTASVWIDYNQNGVYESAERIGSVSEVPGTGTPLQNLNFTVPGTATAGTTGMRVRYRYIAGAGQGGLIDPCIGYTESNTTGGSTETEDYRVSISGAACSGTPTAGNVYAGVSGTVSAVTVCPGATQAMFVTGQTSGVSGITYQWQSSTTAGGTYTNVSGGTGATSSSYTTAALTNGTPSATHLYYKCVITCNGSANSTQTTPVDVTINAAPIIGLDAGGTTTANASMCSTGSPNNVSITASNSAAGTTTYSWSGASVSPSTGATVTVTPATTSNYTVIATANTCNTTATGTITVTPGIVSFSPAAPSVAIGGSVSITASSTGAVSYTWATDASLSTTTGATVSANPLSATTYTVTATAGACSRTGTVTVNVTSGTPGLVNCGYTYSTTSGHSAIVGTSLGAGGSNNYTVDLSLISPVFNFDFNGITYNKFGVNGNGFIWLGGSTPPASTTNPISSSSINVEGVIAPFCGSHASSGSVSYLVSGTSPNRTFSVYWDGGATTEPRFKAILYENDPAGGANSNKIEFSIARMTGLTSMNVNAQSGLRGATNSDYSHLTKPATTGGFDASALTFSTSNGNSGTISCNSADYWNSATTMTFTPTISTPYITPTGTNTVCPGVGVALTANTTVSSPTYQWINFATAAVVAGNVNTYSANESNPGNYFYAVKVTKSGCTRTSVAKAITVESCGPKEWIGGTGSWHTGGNWNPAGEPNGCASDVRISNGSPTISSTDVSVRNIQVAAGSTITLNGKNLNVCGKFNGDTTSSGNAAVVGSGITYINGTAAQTIKGAVKFDILQINNTNGVSLAAGANVQISTGLHLQAGQFNVSDGSLRLLSTSATNFSYIDNFSFGGTPGTLNGSASIERYIPVGGYNQHFITSPIADASIAPLNPSGPNDVHITPTADCDNTKSAATSAYGSIFAYDDGGAGAGKCMLGNWRIKSSGNLTNGLGYSTYLTGGSKLTMTGTPNSGTVTVATKNSGFTAVPLITGMNIDAGWNLVGNPYPSAIHFTAQRSGYANEVQVWQTSGPFAGSWQAYTFDGGTAATIAPFQSFMVFKTAAGAGTFQFNQGERVRNSTQQFYRTEKENSLALEVDYNGVKDITTIDFNPSATDAFDGEYDAHKSDGAAGRPTLYTHAMNKLADWYAVNTVGSLTNTTTVGVGLKAEVNGWMTLSPQGIPSFDPTTYIFLEDKKTGNWHNLRDGAYTFQASKTDAKNRFVLHFTPAANILTNDASCNAAGMINIEQPGSANWNYNMVDNNGIQVASGKLNSGNAVSVSAAPGMYTLNLVDDKGYAVTKLIEVGGTQSTPANIGVTETTVQTSEEITFTGSSDAVLYGWEFGDGTTGTGKVVNHAYATEGVYNVTLTVSNAGGCISATTRTVTITSRSVTGLNELTNSKINIWSSGNEVYVDFRKQTKVEAEIDIYNVIGQQISHEKFGKSTIYSHQFANTEASYVIIKVKNDNEVISKKVFITNAK